MAVQFSSISNTHYWQSKSFSGDVISMACFVKLSVNNADQALICMADEASAGVNYYRLRFANGTTSFAMTHDDGQGSTASSTLTASTGVWYHAAGTCDGLSSRACWTNGANKGTSSSTRTAIASIIDNVALGVIRTSSNNQYLQDGSLFWPAVWQGYALTDDDVAALAKGAPPWTIHPESLLFFTPLQHHTGTPRDWISGSALTKSGLPATEESPHVMSAGGIMLPSLTLPLPVITDIANSGETPGSGTETWNDNSTGNVISGTGFA